MTGKTIAWIAGAAFVGYVVASDHTPPVFHGPIAVVITVIAVWVWWRAFRYARAHPAYQLCRDPRQGHGMVMRFLASRGGPQPSRLQVAVHEAGHLAGIDEAGMHTGGAKVIDKNNGVTTAKNGVFTGRHGSKGEALAILAGMVAEYTWLHREHDVPVDKAKAMTEPTAQHDFSLLPKWAINRGGMLFAKDPHIDPSLLRQAEQLVDRNYARILLTAEILAQYGKAKQIERHP